MQDLPKAQNGKFICRETPPFTEGALAQLQCHEHYGTKSNVYSRLVSENNVLTWKPPSAVCLPVLDNLPVAENGQFFNVSAPPYHEHDISYLECDEGYSSATLIQATVVSKEGVLQWVPPSAACVVPLTELPVAEHGEFYSDNKAPFYENSISHLDCFEGYGVPTPLDAQVVFKNGVLQWDPPSARCLPILEDLPASEHAIYGSEVPSPYFEGDIAYLVNCTEGYATFHVPPSIATRVGDHLQWEPPASECWPFTYSLPLATHGHFVDDAGPGPMRHFEDDSVYLICDEGYGSKTIQESVATVVDGVLQWVPPSATCVPILNHLPAAEKGLFYSDEEAPYVEGNEARLICQEGYVHSTLSKSIAKWNGNRLTWVPESASCVLGEGKKEGYFGNFILWIVLVLFSFLVMRRYARRKVREIKGTRNRGKTVEREE